jgi:hypothetical protein
LSSARYTVSVPLPEQVLHFHLDDGRVAAGFREFGLLHHHRILADHDHIAGANFLSEFHDGSCALLLR